MHDGQLDRLILPHVNSACMQVFLDEVARRPPPERIVMILDGAGGHKLSSLKIPETMRLVCLPPYSLEFNPVEHFWDELREKAFGNVVF